MKILLISHGDFAAGLCSTAKNFFGASNVYSACVTQGNGVADLLSAVDQYLAEWGEEEQVVICSDLKGGSANQTAVKYIVSRPNTFLVSGTNLALVLQLIMATSVTHDSLCEMIENARNDTVLVNDVISTAGKADDDE